MVYVIVDIGDHETIETRVKQDSIAQPHPAAPSSYEEAALQQHPDIETMMDKLVRELARCHINAEGDTPDHPPQIAGIFCRKLYEACAKQNALANKATWRFVDYEEG